MLVSSIRAFVMVGALVGSAAAQGQVWTVDPAGPIPQIATAVALAADGDVILVKPGSYDPVSIVGKSLTIQGDPHATIFFNGLTAFVDHGLLVQDLGPDQRVVVRNIDVQLIFHAEPEAAVAVLQCAGAVHLEDCTFDGSNGPGVTVVGSASVTLERCVVRAKQPFQPFGSTEFVPAAGIHQLGSVVFAFDCTVTGCAGKSALLGQPLTSPGGPGIHLVGGVTFASGTTFTGGIGGGHSFGATCAALVQAGGAGALVEGPSLTNLVLLDSTTAGGAGGVPAASCGGLPPGPTGLDQVILGGTVVEPAATRRAFGFASPVRESQPMLLGFAGELDDQVFAAVSVGPVFGVYLEPLLIAPHVDVNAFTLVPIGAVPALTAHVEFLTAPPLPVGVPFAHFTAQGVFFDANGGLHLSGPTSLLVLDGAL